MGEQAARYVRHAINKIIPRTTLIDEYFGGIGRPLVTPVVSTVERFNSSYHTDTYDLEEAKDFMRLAGYQFPEDRETIPSVETETSGLVMESSQLIMIVLIFTIIRIRPYPRHQY